MVIRYGSASLVGQALGLPLETDDNAKWWSTFWILTGLISVAVSAEWILDLHKKGQYFF